MTRTTCRLISIAALVAALLVAAGPAVADDAGALFKQGMALKEQGKVDDAIAKFEQVVALNAEHGLAWASLGHLYKKKQDYPKAVNAYEQATHWHRERPAL